MNNNRATWFEPDQKCSHPPVPRTKIWRLSLLGGPGVGKGTQAGLLAQQLRACPLSTGDLFRHASACSSSGLSPALRQALEAMHEGRLVTDDTVIQLLRERKTCLSCQGGFLLDGYPRTLAQAQALLALLQTEHLPLDAAVHYTVAEAVLVERISGRRLCPQCKRTWHVKSLPTRSEGLCDDCGAALVQRDDDRPEAVQQRLSLYREAMQPVFEFFRQHHLLLEIDAAADPQTVLQRTLAALASPAAAGQCGTLNPAR